MSRITHNLSEGDGIAGWVFCELDFVRGEAQAEAELAYDAWRRMPGRAGYAVFRAAQDRADAAQDQLAAWVRGSQRDLPAVLTR
jgi:hypothetical protein